MTATLMLQPAMVMCMCYSDGDPAEPQPGGGDGDDDDIGKEHLWPARDGVKVSLERYRVASCKVASGSVYPYAHCGYCRDPCLTDYGLAPGQPCCDEGSRVRERESAVPITPSRP